jgi:iron complex outermembrane receptor protein
MGDLVRGALAANDEPLPFMPAARLGGHVRWDDGRMSAEAGYRHAFAQNRVPPAISEEDPSGIATPAYDLVNLSLGWTLGAGDHVNSITLRVDNALDAKYVDATSRLKTFAFNPGRNFALVYRVLF